MDVLGDEGHLLDDLLLVVELRERLLQLVVQLPEFGEDLLALGLGFLLLQDPPVLVDQLVDGADVLGQLATSRGKNC
ncbi:MAG: hypothetical protein ACKPAH_00555, partial [Verrucomicrobiota bacterium]